MAYRRSLSTRVSLLTQRFNPSFSYILHDDDSKSQPSAAETYSSGSNNFLNHGYHRYNIMKATTGLGSLFRKSGLSPFSLPMGLGSSVCYYSSTAAEEGDNQVECTSEVAELISDNTLDLASSQVSAMSEVAIAAADSFFPIAAVQYFIDGIHSYTGLDWWASIALATIVIRSFTIPILISQLRCTTKLTLMRPRLEQIKEEMQAQDMNPNAISEGQRRMKELFKEYGVTPLAPLRGLFAQGPIFISFYLAITNMAEKVPSFKEGGAFWFTDLTTPDSLYIFPVLTGLSFLVTVECNVSEGLEGNPVAGTIKKFSRGLAVLAVPITMTFPKAIFCYWVTSNLFSLAYGLVIKRPEVKQLLNIPIIPEATAPTAQPAVFSVLSNSVPVSQESSSEFGDNISKPVIKQKLENLENEVKDRETENKK